MRWKGLDLSFHFQPILRSCDVWELSYRPKRKVSHGKKSQIFRIEAFRPISGHPKSTFLALNGHYATKKHQRRSIISSSRKNFSQCYTLPLGCNKIINFEKLKFLQILEFCKLFSVSFFSFNTITVQKSYITCKTKCIGNQILLHLKCLKVWERWFLTKLGESTQPTTGNSKISFFGEFAGYQDERFSAKIIFILSKKRLIQLSYVLQKFKKASKNSHTPIKKLVAP